MIRSMWVSVAGVFLVGSVLALAQEGKALPPLRLSSGTAAGLLISSPAPEYPREVWTVRPSGGVVLRVLIGDTGLVEHVDVVSGPEILRQATVDAVRRRVYRPYVLDGVARKVDTTVVIQPQFGAAPGSLAQVSPTELICGPGYKRVSSGTMAGQLLSRPNPVFIEPMPRNAHVSGGVVMRVCVNKEGAVEKVRVISGPELLREKTVEAISRWKYRPYVEDGVAIAVETIVTLNISFGGG
jgi:outer membrane biosynthesis protein TonB